MADKVKELRKTPSLPLPPEVLEQIKQGGTIERREQFRFVENLNNQLKTLVAEVVDANPKQVEQYRSGKTKVMGFFVGQLMKATQGKANPRQLNELLSKALAD